MYFSCSLLLSYYIHIFPLLPHPSPPPLSLPVPSPLSLFQVMPSSDLCSPGYEVLVQQLIKMFPIVVNFRDFWFEYIFL